MLSLLFILVSGFSASLLASPTKSPIPRPKLSQFIYMETGPNSDQSITIQSAKCNPKHNELQVEQFQSEIKVTDGTVNILNIYARSGACKDSPYSSVWLKEVNIPKNGKPTHVYITILSDNILVL